MQNEDQVKQRNPRADSHRRTEANAKRTERVRDAYYKKKLLLSCWEDMPMATQCREYDYILALRARVRNLKNYLLHRSGPDADVL